MTRDRGQRISDLERILPARQTDRFTAWARSLTDDELDHAIDLLMRELHGEQLTAAEIAEMATWPHAIDDGTLSDDELNARIREVEIELAAFAKVDSIIAHSRQSGR
jgi:hypothetical protein